MGMSSYVTGYKKDEEEKWNKMKAVYNACKSAGIRIPDEVEDEYFDDENPNNISGVEVDISSAIEELTYDSTNAWEVDITKLPKGVRYIRFRNSY